MSRSGRRRSRTPERPNRYRSHRSRSRSPRARRSRSPQRRRRGSPSYERYERTERRERQPAWIDGDISEEDIRQEAGGDAAEFRRLKRLKLNDRGVRCFWQNSPTPSPTPERKPRKSQQTLSGIEPRHLNGVEEPAQMPAEAHEGPEPRPSELMRDEILSQGEEAAALHDKAAELFMVWLADQKAAAAEAERRRKQQEADNVIVGPVLEATEKAAVDYGTHMRPGEGTAMAAYVQSGKRIPRRGEVGMSADQISSFEDLGYVMSGSRHNRMNAIRIRKENQVYTAEEKAALAMFNMEENKRKEQKILSDMQRLVQKTLGETEEEPEAVEDEEAAAS